LATRNCVVFFARKNKGIEVEIKMSKISNIKFSNVHKSTKTMPFSARRPYRAWLSFEETFSDERATYTVHPSGYVFVEKAGLCNGKQLYSYLLTSIHSESRKIIFYENGEIVSQSYLN
jgi:hypothetical protein